MGNLLLAKSRINILVIGIFILFTLLACQLFRVQVVQASNYQSKAANEMQSTRTIPAPRGDITDVNGIAFARSVSAITVVVDQTQITDPARVANFVAPILGLSVADVQENITGTRKYSIVLKNGRPALWDKLTEAIYEYNKTLDDKHFDKRIIGFFPERSYIRTINRDVQWVAAKAIADAVKSSAATSGTVIVMDPKTGAIVAHATAPTFNPNNTKNVALALMRNPSVQDVYEPGSTGKVMTMAAALEEKTVSPTTVFSVPYMLKRGGSTFHDHERHATQHLTASGILAVSSNTGTIKVAETFSHDTLYNYLTKFGIGTKTGSGLPGESAGLLRKVSDWSGTTAPTVAFGQGYSVTAMQATSVFATIANNGVRVSPTVIAGTSDASGHFTPTANRSSVCVMTRTQVVIADTPHPLLVLHLLMLHVLSSA